MFKRLFRRLFGKEGQSPIFWLVLGLLWSISTFLEILENGFLPAYVLFCHYIGMLVPFILRLNNANLKGGAPVLYMLG
ncbi:hypothetical protein [Mahella sp.]|uniref:hypothetical protein n=1 Tax=Mahella sp. TaxID=2798721 RepID=UPI0025BD648D|nr:hypothetical protein [Mahella sp.]